MIMRLQGGNTKEVLAHIEDRGIEKILARCKNLSGVVTLKGLKEASRGAKVRDSSLH